MILKEIYLYPEVMDYGEELTYQFKDLTRPLCNYLGRKVKEAKCETNGFNWICFIGLRDIDNKYNVPKDKISNAIDEFAESGFVNEWIFKKKNKRP